jgi:hypothetical protein
MPDWIGDQRAGVGPEATWVFGRNAQIAVVSGRRPVVKGCFEAIVNVSSAVMSTAC